MTEFDQELAGLPEEQRPKDVVFIVVTDGQENSSREWTRNEVFAQVRERTGQGWVFLYIGANQDAVREGARYGVPGAQSVTYTADSGGTQAAFAATTSTVSRARRGGPAGFTDTDRRAATGT